MSKLGRKGGNATKKKGKKYFSKIGKKGYKNLIKKIKSSQNTNICDDL